MGNKIVSVQDQKQLEANIQFYKQEINFLLKVLTKEYSNCMSHKETIKLLDSFWKEFEKYKQKLSELEYKINIHKQEIILFCKKRINFNESEEKQLSVEYSGIINALKTIKKNFYNYLESDTKHKITFSLM